MSQDFDTPEAMRRLERDGNITVGTVMADGSTLSSILCDCGWSRLLQPTLEDCGKAYREHCAVVHPDRQVLDFIPTKERMS